jgi:hypothetical protein
MKRLGESALFVYLKKGAEEVGGSHLLALNPIEHATRATRPARNGPTAQHNNKAAKKISISIWRERL